MIIFEDDVTFLCHDTLIVRDASGVKATIPLDVWLSQNSEAILVPDDPAQYSYIEEYVALRDSLGL